MKNFLNINKKFKNNKGSITSFTLLSMLFFLIVVIAIYASVNTKVQKQQKELNTIQKSYEQQEQINDIYEKKYDDYINSETSTIQVYADTNLKGEVKGQKKNTLGTVYTNVAQNKIKIFGGANSTYAYSETADGKRIVLSGNEMTIQATTSGKTIYTWVKGEDGEYTKYYTAVTVKLSTLQDKTIYVAEGKSTDIEINGENKGKITYSQIDTSYISIENNKVTGIKAGDTTITATESNGGAQAKITIKIVKLTLEKTKGITTVGDNKKIQVSGINNGTISAKSNDETIAKVTVSGTELTIIPQKVGNTKIIITESNAGANIEYEIQVVGITLAPNGGTYTMPTTGKATIKTKVNVENASKIEVAWTSENLEWKTIENNSETIKNNCEQGKYYLYVKVDNEYLYQSQAFIVGEEKIAINIKTSTTEWTNQDITATIEYPNITISSTRKAGYGSTLANAQTTASSATAPTTNVTVTANGYIYATATDSAGNVITASKQITNIDKTLPTVTLSPNGGSYAKPTSGNATIKTKITASNTGGSGLKTLQYAWSTSNTTEPTTYTTFTNGATVSKTDCTTGTYYLWTRVYDNAGNRAITGKVSAGFVVGAKTIIITPNTTAWTNQNVTATIAYPDVTTSSTRKAGYGTTLANAQTSANSAPAPATSITVNANGYVFATATDGAGNVITASKQITNIDKTLPTVTLSPNGGSYAKPTSGNATIKTKITASNTGGSGLKTLQYAWSTSNTTEPTTYTTFTNGAILSKTDCVAGTYYLWTNVYDNANNRTTNVKVSAGFVVGAKTITITPNTTAWTNQNITATITYPDVTTSNTRKAGYGTTLANAQTSANSATAPTTSLTVSANGYVFATATDSAGNVITASRQITNIDKIAPIISEIKNSSNENWTNKTISLSWTITENGGSGISEVRFGRDGINWIDKLAQNEWYGFTRNYERNDAIYLQVIDKAGNKSNIVSTKMKADLTEPQVTISPNGGSYAAPSAGSMATIKTTLTASDTGGSGLKTLEYAWSTSNTTEPTTYTTFTNGATVSKTDCTTGTYYLWTRVYDNAGNRATKGKVSSEFFVGTMAITITPSTTAWTNQNVIATVKYPDATVSNTRKAGFGTTLESAKTAANSSTAPATSVTASQNGYIYATATDVSGNVLTMTRQISNIDKTGPVISEITNSSNQNWTNQAIKLSWTITENGSGISKVRFGYDGVNWQDYLNETEWYGMTRNNERNDRIYIMAIDKTGNTSNIVSTALKIDKSAPAMVTPTISPSGWTNGNVTLTGKATDTASGISYYQWSTNSNLTASSSGWTSITNTKSQISQNYTATANGTYYFYAKDASGNVGKASIKITSIDKNAPTINSALKSTGTTINSISLSLGVAADTGGSGLKKIEWYYGTTNNPTTKAGETAITTAQTATYTVSNLSLVTTYYFKVIVYDVAGNKVSSSVISAKTANPKAEDVSYTPADSNWKVNNVKEALDYFFNK